MNWPERVFTVVEENGKWGWSATQDGKIVDGSPIKFKTQEEAEKQIATRKAIYELHGPQR